MAKAKIKFPLDSITGTLQGSDRTIGRDKGLSSTLRKINKGTAGDKNNQVKTQLVLLTPPPQAGSPARHARAQVYCDCDDCFKQMISFKLSIIQEWWRYVRDNMSLSMSAYNIYMKICLKGLIEYRCFLRFSYCTRYIIKNTRDYDLSDWTIILEDIPVFQPDWEDLEVYLLLAVTTKKGRITYDPKMIDYRLVHNVFEPGKVEVFIPSLQPGASLLIDVYSYYKP